MGVSRETSLQLCLLSNTGLLVRCLRLPGTCCALVGSHLFLFKCPRAWFLKRKCTKSLRALPVHLHAVLARPQLPPAIYAMDSCSGHSSPGICCSFQILDIFMSRCKLLSSIWIKYASYWATKHSFWFICWEMKISDFFFWCIMVF